MQGQYFDNPSPVTGKTVCEIARSTREDIELALDAAHRARKERGARHFAATAPTC